MRALDAASRELFVSVAAHDKLIAIGVMHVENYVIIVTSSIIIIIVSTPTILTFTKGNGSKDSAWAIDDDAGDYYDAHFGSN